MGGAQENNGWSPGNQWLGPRKQMVVESGKSMVGAQETNVWGLGYQWLGLRKPMVRTQDINSWGP